MGEPTFLDYVGCYVRMPVVWLPWLAAVAAFVLTWMRDRRIHAFILLGVSAQLAILVVVCSVMFLLLSFSNCGSHAWLRDFLMTLPVVWLPVVASGIPVLLRTPWREVDRAFRRVWLFMAVAALDVLGASLGALYLLTVSCGRGHDWTFMLGP